MADKIEETRPAPVATASTAREADDQSASLGLAPGDTASFEDYERCSKFLRKDAFQPKTSLKL